MSRQSQRTSNNVIYDGPANCLTTFHRFEFFPHETPKMTPMGLNGLICLAYVYSQVNLQTWQNLVAIGPAVQQRSQISEFLTH